MATHLRRVAAVCATLAISACSGGGSGDDPGPAPCSTGSCTVGSSGGTVSATNGPAVTFPAAALPADTAVTVAQVAAAPAGALSPVFEFRPAGASFAVPVTVRFPVPAGTASASIYWTRPGSTTAFEALPTTVSGATATAAVTHFSLGYVGQACTPDETCVPANPCHAGTRTCDGAPACVDQGTELADGASCPAGVCSAGACVAACVPGAACTPAGAADPCRTYEKVCDATLTGFTCEQAGNAAEGTACPAGVCSAGACVAACVPAEACTPGGAADACRTYAKVCNDTLTGFTCDPAGNAAEGTACPAGVCSAGACVAACVPGAACTPAGAADPCRTYGKACNATLTGFTCDPAGNAADGTTCPGGRCSGGACVPLNVPTVPAAVTAVPRNGAAAVAWSPSAGATGYRVYHSASPTVTMSSPFVAASGPQAVVDALANGAVRYFAVSALTPDGESGLSELACAVPTSADTAGLTLHDGLCGARFDASRWPGQAATSVRVSGGAAVFAVDAANQEPRTLRGTTYTAARTVASGGQRVSTLAATIVVPRATASRAGGAVNRAAVRLGYQPPALRSAGSRDFLDLTVGLLDAGDGLRVFRQVGHCEDASCATYATGGIAFEDPAGLTSIGTYAAGAPASYGTAYRVTARLDEATGVFHWTVAGGEFGAGISGTANPSAYLASAASWSGLALAGSGFAHAQLQARTHDASTNGGGSGTITASFDDVWIGLGGAAPALFDDFGGAGGNSGPTGLSPAKWAPQGVRVQMPDGGSLLSQAEIQSATTGGASSFHGLVLPSPASIDAFQAETWMPFTRSAGGATPTFISYLQGRYYATAGGDVSAQLMLNAATNTAHYTIGRCNDAGCSSQTVLGSGSLGAIDPSVRHVLRIAWDPVARTLTYSVDGASTTVDPQVTGAGMSQAAPYAGPPASPQRAILTGVIIPAGATAAGATASADVRVSNVFTGGASYPTAAAPTFSPPAGTYDSARSVALSTTTAGATIRYTTDGSTPGPASAVYTAAIPVSVSSTIRAYATAPGHIPSPIASASYAIQPGGSAFWSFCGEYRPAVAARESACLAVNPASAERELFLSCDYWGNEIAAGRLAFDATRTQECLAAVNALSCVDFEARAWPAACIATIRGAVQNGGSCNDHMQCANGWCRTDTYTCPGTCTAFVAGGASCAGYASVCEPGFLCAGPTGAETCVAVRGLGQACGVEHGWCGSGLYCTSWQQGTCEALRTSGDCTNAPEACAAGFTCQPGQFSSSSCVPLRGRGESCGIGEASCGGGWNCIKAAGAVLGTCTAPGALGASCADTSACVPQASDWGCMSCEAGLCDLATGRCRPYRGVGEPCVYSEECYDGVCTGTPPETPGECIVPVCQL